MLDQQVFRELECCRIQPLQVVQKECQRMSRAGEDADKPSKGEVGAGLSLVGRQGRHGRLFADDQLQLRYEIHQEMAIRTERVMKIVAPFAQLRLRPAQKRADEALECLRYRGVRNVSFVLVELA